VITFTAFKQSAAAKKSRQIAETIARGVSHLQTQCRPSHLRAGLTTDHWKSAS
jgi:hypothetical protein